MRRNSKKGAEKNPAEATTAVPTIPASSFIASRDAPKLSAWLARHPGTVDFLAFQHHEEARDAKYYEYRQQEIGRQILRGFELISDYEKRCTQPPKLEHHQPDPALKRLEEAIEFSKIILYKEIAAKAWEKRLFSHLVLKYQSTKTTIARLMSLLASIDAFPLDHVPVVDFERLKMSPEDFIEQDETLKSFRDAAQNCSETVALVNEQLKLISGRYSKGGKFESAEAMKNELHHKVNDCTHEMEDNKECVRVVMYPSPFLDILLHPHSKAHQFVKKFMEEKTGEAFAKLNKNIAKFCGLETAQEHALLNAMLLVTIGTDCAPIVKCDGKGTADDDLLAYGLELFGTCDPIGTILAIVKRMGDRDAKEGVKEAADALKAITSSYKEVLAFVHDFTSPEYLGPKGQAVRACIGQLLSDSC